MSEVFELTYHGGGGFTYSEVWNMDIPKRKFNLKKIKEFLEEMEKMRNDSAQKITEKTDPKTIKIPDFAKMNQKDNAFVSKVKSKR